MGHEHPKRPQQGARTSKKTTTWGTNIQKDHNMGHELPKRPQHGARTSRSCFGTGKKTKIIPELMRS